MSINCILTHFSNLFLTRLYPNTVMYLRVPTATMYNRNTYYQIPSTQCTNESCTVMYLPTLCSGVPCTLDEASRKSRNT